MTAAARMHLNSLRASTVVDDDNHHHNDCKLIDGHTKLYHDSPQKKMCCVQIDFMKTLWANQNIF